jgi:hypothetical protein
LDEREITGHRRIDNWPKSPISNGVTQQGFDMKMDPAKPDLAAMKDQIEIVELRARDIEAQARVVEARIRFAEASSKWREMQQQTKKKSSKLGA